MFVSGSRKPVRAWPSFPVGESLGKYVSGHELSMATLNAIDSPLLDTKVRKWTAKESLKGPVESPDHPSTSERHGEIERETHELEHEFGDELAGANHEQLSKPMLHVLPPLWGHVMPSD